MHTDMMIEYLDKNGPSVIRQVRPFRRSLPYCGTPRQEWYQSDVDPTSKPFEKISPAGVTMPVAMISVHGCHGCHMGMGAPYTSWVPPSPGRVRWGRVLLPLFAWRTRYSAVSTSIGNAGSAAHSWSEAM